MVWNIDQLAEIFLNVSPVAGDALAYDHSREAMRVTTKRAFKRYEWCNFEVGAFFLRCICVFPEN